MERPTIVSAFGILNIAFAAGRLVKLLLYIPIHARAVAHHGSTLTRTLQENPYYALWSKCAVPLGFLSIVLLLVAGIGLLRMEPWARKLSIVYGVYAILATVASTVVNIVFVVQPLLSRASVTRGAYALPVALGGEIGTILAGLIALVYPVLLIVTMTRPHIAAAFRPPAPPPSLP